MWDQVKALGNKEPMYFGPLYRCTIEELERRGIDQDKKSKKSFKWTSGKASDPVGKMENAENQGSPKECAIDIPTWDGFTNTTTFHGVRYIFSKSSGKIRRYGH